jgi:hypothetical protein
MLREHKQIGRSPRQGYCPAVNDASGRLSHIATAASEATVAKHEHLNQRTAEAHRSYGHVQQQFSLLYVS